MESLISLRDRRVAGDSPASIPLRDWDITDRLGEIEVATLLVSGRYDEATPRIVEEIHRRIEGSR